MCLCVFYVVARITYCCILCFALLLLLVGGLFGLPFAAYTGNASLVIDALRITSCCILLIYVAFIVVGWVA